MSVHPLWIRHRLCIQSMYCIRNAFAKQRQHLLHIPWSILSQVSNIVSHKVVQGAVSCPSQCQLCNSITQTHALQSTSPHFLVSSSDFFQERQEISQRYPTDPISNLVCMKEQACQGLVTASSLNDMAVTSINLGIKAFKAIFIPEITTDVWTLDLSWTDLDPCTFSQSHKSAAKCESLLNVKH